MAPANTSALPKLIDVPLTVPTIETPRSLFPLSFHEITTLLLLESKVVAVEFISELLKSSVDPKLMSVPLTVPTIAFPLALFPTSRKEITTLLELLSNVEDMKES